MSLTLADILREHWASYARAHRVHLSTVHYRAVDSVLACRGPKLGGKLYQCDACDKWHFAYHSCNHRSCPQCGALDQQIWTAKQEARLLPVPYYLITFTMPEELRPLCKAHPADLYHLMLRESAGALQDVLGTKLKGAGGGFTSVLHTWGRQIQHHPHIHIVIPAVAFNRASKALIHPSKSDQFLVHYHPLADRFRNRMRLALNQRHPEYVEAFQLGSRKVFAPKKKWVCHVKAVGRGKTALRYLARYVKRSAFSAKRLYGYNQRGDILLGWQSSSTGKRGTLVLQPHEFIRRWLLHVLPKGFTSVRHYGFLSSAAKRTRLKIRALLGELGEPLPDLPELEPFNCSECGGALSYVREIPRLRPTRGPPYLVIEEPKAKPKPKG